eukprot:481252-Prymnesium_polylepis.1
MCTSYSRNEPWMYRNTPVMRAAAVWYIKWSAGRRRPKRQTGTHGAWLARDKLHGLAGGARISLVGR